VANGEDAAHNEGDITMQRRHLLQAASAALAAPHLAFAQGYPAKPIRYIVPVAAGGGNDMIARVVAERWGRLLGQSFVVDNQSGGGGVVACQTTARAAPDGYTLMQGYVATHGTTPATRRVSYDAIKDFTPIGMIGATPNVLAINAEVPAKNVQEFVDYVKRNPGKVSYGSAGAGSLTHLTMELLKQETGAFMLHIPTAASRRPSTTCSAARPRPCSPASRRPCRTCARAACARWPSPASGAARS
jgi:tripartite-type tricarboxylate transporter receptor subunit TctC